MIHRWDGFFHSIQCHIRQYWGDNSPLWCSCCGRIQMSITIRTIHSGIAPNGRGSRLGNLWCNFLSIGRVRRATQRLGNGLETLRPPRSAFGAASQTAVINHLIFRQCLVMVRKIRTCSILYGYPHKTTDYTRLTQKSRVNLCNLVVKILKTTTYPSMYED